MFLGSYRYDEGLRVDGPATGGRHADGEIHRVHVSDLVPT
jgi:hypothetical protein